MEKLVYKHTDTERLNILKAFSEYLIKNANSQDCIFEEYQINLIEDNLSTFEKIKTYKDCVRQQEENFEKKYEELFYKAKTFVSHYYMAMHMAIERGELKPETTSWYGLQFPFNIPNPRNGVELLEIAETLFTSDQKRITEGGRLFSNPNISSVKIWVEKFQEIYQEKYYRQNTKQAEVENIENIRKYTDNIILETYDKLLEKYAEMDSTERIPIIESFGFEIKVIIKKPRIKNQEQTKSKPKVKTQLQFALF